MARCPRLFLLIAALLALLVAGCGDDDCTTCPDTQVVPRFSIMVEYPVFLDEGGASDPRTVVRLFAYDQDSAPELLINDGPALEMRWDGYEERWSAVATLDGHLELAWDLTTDRGFADGVVPLPTDLEEVRCNGYPLTEGATNELVEADSYVFTWTVGAPTMVGAMWADDRGVNYGRIPLETELVLTQLPGHISFFTDSGTDGRDTECGRVSVSAFGDWYGVGLVAYPPEDP